MALRRELLPILLAAAFVLLGPGQALAAPQWRPAETRDVSAPSNLAADVAADALGNSVAVWLAGGEVRAAYRPRGGPWGPSDRLDPGTPLVETQPRVTVQPNGQFVAAWVGDRVLGPSYPLRWARRPAGGGWSAPDTITGIGCCPGIGALEASADGSVTVMPLDEGSPSSNTKPPGAETWGPDENMPTGQGTRLAVAPDGSAVAVDASDCDPDPEVVIPCIRAAYRPPGGAWGPLEEAGRATDVQLISGFEVAAAPTSSYTVTWGETANSDGANAPPGAVRSADRGPGAAGAWAAPETVADLPDEMPFCNFSNCFDLAVGPGGTQLAAWHQTGVTARIAAALRPPGGSWASPEIVGDTGTSAAIPFAALTTGGVPVVVWGAAATGEGVAHGAHRDAGGWHPVELDTVGSGGGQPPENGAYVGDLAADGEGNALTAWKDPEGVRTAGFDGAAPRFTAFSLPSGPAGQALAFSAAADDNWSGPASISWLFGDGGGAIGGAVSHAYGAAGSYATTATATDASGNAAQQAGQVAVTAAPNPPDPCGTADTDKDGIKNGCDDNNGAKRPVPFKTVNATVVSGDVFVKLPAGSASASQAKPPKGFKRLEGAETIPVGSTLDTARGRVKIRSAADTRRKTQTGQFYRGRFVIRQARIKRRSRKLITDMRLNGSSFKKRCRATASVSQKRRKRSKRKVRRLFGDAKGSFRTSGRNAAATVRGTRWGVQDRCDGTLVAVQRGRVEVRDKVKRKTIILRRGRTYLARAR